MRRLIGIVMGFSCLFSAWAGEIDEIKFHDIQGISISRESMQGHKTLVAFWRSDCMPCLHEMRILPAIAKQNPGLLINLISLQNSKHTKQYLTPLPSNVQVLIAEGESKKLLADFGSERTLALPYSVMLTKKGEVCAKYYGILYPDKIKEWQKIC